MQIIESSKETTMPKTNKLQVLKYNTIVEHETYYDNCWYKGSGQCISQHPSSSGKQTVWIKKAGLGGEIELELNFGFWNHDSLPVLALPAQGQIRLETNLYRTS
jgi:hypothetical protein